MEDYKLFFRGSEVLSIMRQDSDDMCEVCSNLVNTFCVITTSNDYCKACDKCIKNSNEFKRLTQFEADNIREKQIFRKAIETFGEIHQLSILQEESAELIQAISKVFREENEESLTNLLEEMVDVYITLEQAKLILEERYGLTDFNDLYSVQLKRKLLKLEGYLDK